MPDPSQIQEIVDRILSEVAEKHLSALRKEVSKRVLQEMEPMLSASARDSSSELLNAAVASIHDGSSQAEILKALLDGASKFSGRAALFVLRGESAVGWQARGFADNEGIKKFSIDASRGMAARALRDGGAVVAAAAADFDSAFNKAVGNPANGNAMVFPLLVKDKVPALLYADSGSDAAGKLDPAGVELLTRSAGLWLENVLLRKAGPAAGEAVPAERISERMETPTPAAPPEAAPMAAAAAASASGSVVAPALSAEEEEVHKKAKRFAKLLVEEIRLYNQSKVTQGKKHKDLYDRLKEDIEKSRTSYDKRYGQSAAAAADYFTQELIRVLADNDASLLGDNFSR